MMKRSLFPFAGLILSCATIGIAASTSTPSDDLSQAQAGGPGGTFFLGAEGFSMPMGTATRKHRADFVVGKSLFKENWVSTPSSVRNRQGLGPMFNAQSCSTCHFKDGRGQPPTNPAESFTSMLVRMSIPGEDAHGGPKPVPGYGDQFNHRANVGVRSEGDVHVRFIETSGAYADGTKFSLSEPRYEFTGLQFGPLPENVMLSGRVAPQVVGLGLLEAIPEKDILALADPDDRDRDGVSGRPNRVWDVRAKTKRLGRFGWKSNQPSVRQQNAGALIGDMGVTSPLFPGQNCNAGAEDCLKAPALKTAEIDDSDLDRMEAYIKLVAVPARRNLKDPAVRAGQRAFLDAKCQACHIPSFTTGVDPKFPELSRVRIHPYTDLLLHDLGEGLADHRPDFAATGSEWRTAPLWGIGVIPAVNGHSRLLHDGRARTIEEAILWHGGEAEGAKGRFLKMAEIDRKNLIRFVESL